VRRILAGLIALPLAATPLSAAGPAAEQARDRLALLRRADVGAATPESFRAELTLRVSGRAAAARIEVWRSGEARTLVRFLEPRDKGKYLLYGEGEVWFLSPSAKPVKLPRAYRLRGSVTLDDILGRRYSRDYSVASAEAREDGGHTVIAYDLRAISEKNQYARVLYVVRPDTGRPIRAEFHLRSGRRASVLEFVEWASQQGRKLRPRRLALRDELRGGELTEVEVEELEERDVPDGLFDRQDGAARKRLENEPGP